MLSPLDLWPWLWANLNTFFKWHIYSWWRTIVQINIHWNPSKIVGVWSGQKFDLQMWPWPWSTWMNVSNGTSTRDGDTLFWNPSTLVMVYTKSDGHTHTQERVHKRMHIHQTVIVRTMSRSPQTGSRTMSRPPKPGMTIIFRNLGLISVTSGPFVQSVDQGQTAQNMQSFPLSTLSEKDILSNINPKITLKMQHLGFLLMAEKFHVTCPQIPKHTLVSTCLQ